MEITHYCNSFLSVKSGKSILACDPWVGKGNQNSWLSTPLYENGSSILNNLNPNFIYISHLHCDHFDPNILLNFKNKKKKIIIKKFSDCRLKNQINKLGFKNILEIDEWKKVKLNKDITISIIPQMSSNTKELPEQINYDLDTSILIQSNYSKEVFFNNVDNPLSLKDLNRVKKFVKKIFYRNIDIACLPVGAAGEYPQCFLNINRKIEKKKIIHESLLQAKKQLKVLKPEIFFSAGGTYTIFGKYNSLNKFIAIPNKEEIKDFLQNKKIKMFNMEGGKTLKKINKKWILEDNLNLIKNSKIKKTIKKFNEENYFYSKKYKNIKISQIDKIYLEASKKYHNILLRFATKTNWKVEFVIYKNLSINKNGKIETNKSNLLKRYFLQNNKHKNKRPTKLICHLDFNLFYGLLKRKYVWNQPMAGSSILYEREPNKFDPNLSYSLNFLGT